MERKIQTIRQFAQDHPQHTQHSLRWLIARASENGFEKVIVRIGRRVYLDPAKYFEWVNEQQEGKK